MGVGKKYTLQHLARPCGGTEGWQKHFWAKRFGISYLKFEKGRDAKQRKISNNEGRRIAARKRKRRKKTQPRMDTNGHEWEARRWQANGGGAETGVGAKWAREF